MRRNIEWMRWPVGRSLGAGDHWDATLGMFAEMRSGGARDDYRWDATLGRDIEWMTIVGIRVGI